MMLCAGELGMKVGVTRATAIGDRRALVGLGGLHAVTLPRSGVTARYRQPRPSAGRPVPGAECGPRRQGSRLGAPARTRWHSYEQRRVRASAQEPDLVTGAGAAFDVGAARSGMLGGTGSGASSRPKGVSSFRRAIRPPPSPAPRDGRRRDGWRLQEPTAWARSRAQRQPTRRPSRTGPDRSHASRSGPGGHLASGSTRHRRPVTLADHLQPSADGSAHEIKRDGPSAASSGPAPGRVPLIAHG